MWTAVCVCCGSSSFHQLSYAPSTDSLVLSSPHPLRLWLLVQQVLLLPSASLALLRVLRRGPQMAAGRVVGQMVEVANQGWEIQVALPLQQGAVQMVVGVGQMEVASQMLAQALLRVAVPMWTENQRLEVAPLWKALAAWASAAAVRAGAVWAAAAPAADAAAVWLMHVA